jgi:hypothetical protein
MADNVEVEFQVISALRFEQPLSFITVNPHLITPAMDCVLDSWIVRFEVLTAVVMKSSVFWDITTCSPLKVSRRFGGTCNLHLRESKWQAELRLSPAFTLVSCLDPEVGGDTLLRNVG